MLCTMLVAVLQVCGESERTFIKQLEAGLNDQADLQIEYVDKIQHRQPETILHLHLRKYKERFMPMIVLITYNFLNSVWPTIYKLNILKEISKYTQNRCLHIWLDNINERTMRKYSTLLCRTDGSFTRVKESELGSSSKELVQEIQRRMEGPVRPRFPYQNFALDNLGEYSEFMESKSKNMPSISSDEGMHSLTVSGSLKDHHQKISAAAAAVSSFPTESLKVNPKPKKKRQESVYKAAANVMADYVRDSVQVNTPSSTRNPESTTSKKKKKKKKTVNSLMSDLTHKQLYEISLLLDVGFGANWKQIAALFDVDQITIKNIELALQRQESPTMNLLSLLRVRRPELNVGQFICQCKIIARFDVVRLIEQDILKT